MSFPYPFLSLFYTRHPHSRCRYVVLRLAMLSKGSRAAAHTSEPPPPPKLLPHDLGSVRLASQTLASARGAGPAGRFKDTTTRKVAINVILLWFRADLKPFPPATEIAV